MNYKRITPPWLAWARRWGLDIVLDYLSVVKCATLESITEACGNILTPARVKALRERGIISLAGRHGKNITLTGRGLEVLDVYDRLAWVPHGKREWDEVLEGLENNGWPRPRRTIARANRHRKATRNNKGGLHVHTKRTTETTTQGRRG